MVVIKIKIKTTERERQGGVMIMKLTGKIEVSKENGKSYNGCSHVTKQYSGTVSTSAIVSQHK